MINFYERVSESYFKLRSYDVDEAEAKKNEFEIKNNEVYLRNMSDVELKKFLKDKCSDMGKELALATKEKTKPILNVISSCDLFLKALDNYGSKGNYDRALELFLQKEAEKRTEQNLRNVNKEKIRKIGKNFVLITLTVSAVVGINYGLVKSGIISPGSNNNVLTPDRKEYYVDNDVYRDNKYHFVVEDERTVEEVAEKYGVSPSFIQVISEDPKALKPGDEIIIFGPLSPRIDSGRSK